MSGEEAPPYPDVKLQRLGQSRGFGLTPEELGTG